jgi:hypothetical protein
MDRRVWLAIAVAAWATTGCSDTGKVARTGRSAALSTSSSVQTTTSTSILASPSTAPASSIVPQTATPPAGCVNGHTTASLEAALVAANGTPGGQVVPGSLYYGTCGITGYAVARFEPGPGATGQEQVAFQDAGSVAHYFVQPQGQPWRLVGSAPYPSHGMNCRTFAQLPGTLRAIWQDCPNG